MEEKSRRASAIFYSDEEDDDEDSRDNEGSEKQEQLVEWVDVIDIGPPLYDSLKHSCIFFATYHKLI